MSNTAASQLTDNAGADHDPLAQYTRSLHDYTLALWTESRRIAEEKARAQQIEQPGASAETNEGKETGQPGAQASQSTSPADRRARKPSLSDLIPLPGWSQSTDLQRLGYTVGSYLFSLISQMI
ncbi:hypothetical protein BDZ97DRAFT_1758291 [Flammula alnicola]|nr:hypothetical protein BDZ97DRAFT_1758291 [Flammula alnicola]